MAAEAEAVAAAAGAVAAAVGSGKIDHLLGKYLDSESAEDGGVVSTLCTYFKHKAHSDILLT